MRVGRTAHFGVVIRVAADGAAQVVQYLRTGTLQQVVQHRARLQVDAGAHVAARRAAFVGNAGTS